MSKGEGVQAYGYGRYDAGNIDVAEDYKKNLGAHIQIDGKDLLIGGKKVGTTGDDYADDLLLANAGDVKAAIKEITDDIAKMGIDKIRKYKRS